MFAITTSSTNGHLMNIQNGHENHNMFTATGTQCKRTFAAVEGTSTRSPETLQPFQGSLFAIRDNGFSSSPHATSLMPSNHNGGYAPNQNSLPNGSDNHEYQASIGGYNGFTSSASLGNYRMSEEDQSCANAYHKQRRKSLLARSLSSERSNTDPCTGSGVYGEQPAGNGVRESQCIVKIEPSNEYGLVDRPNGEYSNLSNGAHGFEWRVKDRSNDADFDEVAKKRRRPNLLEAIDNLRNMRAHDSTKINITTESTNDSNLHYFNNEPRLQELGFSIPHATAVNYDHRGRKSVIGCNNITAVGSDQASFMDFELDVTRVNMESSIINDALLRVKNVGIQNCGTRTQHEFQLFYLLNKANLIHYYNALVNAGGDDLIQLCQLSKKDLNSLIHLIDMHHKPFHVKRFKKIISRLRLKLRLIRSKETDVSDNEECSVSEILRTFAKGAEKAQDCHSEEVVADTFSKMLPSGPIQSPAVSSTASTPGIVSSGETNLYSIIACDGGYEQGSLGNEALSGCEADADRERNVEMIIRDVLSSDTDQGYIKTHFSGYEILADECNAVCQESPPEEGMMLGSSRATLRQSISSITYNLFAMDTFDQSKAKLMNDIAVQLCIRRPNLLTRKPKLIELTKEASTRIKVFDNGRLAMSSGISSECPSAGSNAVFDGNVTIKAEFVTNDG